jgi:hypothetical protein
MDSGQWTAGGFSQSKNALFPHIPLGKVKKKNLQISQLDQHKAIAFACGPSKAVGLALAELVRTVLLWVIGTHL